MQKSKTTTQNAVLADLVATFRLFLSKGRSALNRHAPRKVLGFVILILLAPTAPSLAQTDQSGQGPAVEATLRYSEPAEKEPVECISSDMVTAVECVARREAGETEIIDTGAMATAIMTLILEPKLTVLEDGTFIASIRVTERMYLGLVSAA